MRLFLKLLAKVRRHVINCVSNHCLSLCLLCIVPSAWSQPDWRLQVQSLPSKALILMGEQHDAAEHQDLARRSVAKLAGNQALSAIVLEMVDDGFNTQGMSSQASEDLVRERLQWNNAGWSWQRYGPIVMQAVRAGVPVVGGNLPRAAMGAVMSDEQWDTQVSSNILGIHRQSMLQSHCGLLPPSQVPAMARIQIARDERMARTATRWLRKGQTVLLLAGAEHVKRDRGIPLFIKTLLPQEIGVVWLQATTTVLTDPQLADSYWQTPPVPFKDYCAELIQTLKP